MDEELNSIERQKVWEEANSNTHKNILKTVWTYKVKKNSHGDPERFKARLCVQGFDQIQGIDY